APRPAVGSAACHGLSFLRFIRRRGPCATGGALSVTAVGEESGGNRPEGTRRTPNRPWRKLNAPAARVEGECRPARQLHAGRNSDGGRISAGRGRDWRGGDWLQRGVLPGA